MLLLTTSKRGARGVINRSRPLQSKRGFLFFPRRNDSPRVLMPWGWCRKRIAITPEKLMFILKNTSASQLRTSWGRKWHFEAKDGVFKESTSEFVPGKGWVNTESIRSESGAQKKSDCNNKVSEESDIDLITLRRVPRNKAAVKPETPWEEWEPSPAARREEEIEEISQLLNSTHKPEANNSLVESLAEYTKNIVEKGKRGASESKTPPGKATVPPKTTAEAKQEASNAGPAPLEGLGAKKEPKVAPQEVKVSESETKATETKTSSAPVTPPETTDSQTDKPFQSPEESLNPPQKTQKTIQSEKAESTLVSDGSVKVDGGILQLLQSQLEKALSAGGRTVSKFKIDNFANGEGAPGKPILKAESEAEKEKRRKSMASKPDNLKERENISEVFEGLGAAWDRIRLRATSLGLHPGVGARKSEGSNTDKAPVVPTQKTPGKEFIAEETHEKDYEWTGTENVSAEDVLKSVGPKIDSAKPIIPVTVEQTTFEVKPPPIAKPPPTPTPPTPPQNYYILVRSPESGSMYFTSLPSILITESLARGNTAFDALRNLNSPHSFLPLWRILQKGGFTVVGGGKDCLIVKVDAEGSKAKQVSVLKEIGLKVSPAEVVARESWEKAKANGGLGTPPGDSVAGSFSHVNNKIAPPIITTPDTNQQKSEKILEPIPKNHAPKVEQAKVKSRPFRRIFWSAVWVGACSGGVSIGLESYL